MINLLCCVYTVSYMLDFQYEIVQIFTHFIVEKGYSNMVLKVACIVKNNRCKGHVATLRITTIKKMFFFVLHNDAHSDLNGNSCLYKHVLYTLLLSLIFHSYTLSLSLSLCLVLPTLWGHASKSWVVGTW